VNALLLIGNAFFVVLHGALALYRHETGAEWQFNAYLALLCGVGCITLMLASIHDRLADDTN
jgi:tellurite resistance protein TehA-like permease